MKKFGLLLALAALSSTGVAFAADTAGVVPVVGKMMYSTGGKKLTAVYKLDTTGAPQILLDGKLVTIPAATLTEVDGRIETSMTRKDLMTQR